MFQKLNEETWDFAISRDLRVGPPNSGKSQSLLTNERPTIVISYPHSYSVAAVVIPREGS